MLFFETWKPKTQGGFSYNKTPMVTLNKHSLSFNHAALEECMKSAERVTILPDPKTPAIGFCFHNGDMEGDFIIRRTKAAKPSAIVHSKALYDAYPIFLSTAVQIGMKRFEIHVVAEDDVPEDFKGSQLFVIRIQKKTL